MKLNGISKKTKLTLKFELKHEKTSSFPTPIHKTKRGNTNLKSKTKPRKVLKNKGARARNLREVQGSRKRYLKAPNNRTKRDTEKQQNQERC